MKKISVSFTCEINLKDESNIDVDCVRDTMCLAFGSVVSNWTDDAKNELALAQSPKEVWSKLNRLVLIMSAKMRLRQGYLG